MLFLLLLIASSNAAACDPAIPNVATCAANGTDAATCSDGYFLKNAKAAVEAQAAVEAKAAVVAQAESSPGAGDAVEAVAAVAAQDAVAAEAAVTLGCYALATGGKTGADDTGALTDCLDEGYYFKSAVAAVAAADAIPETGGGVAGGGTDAVAAVEAKAAVPASCPPLAAGGKTGDDQTGALLSCLDTHTYKAAVAASAAVAAAAETGGGAAAGGTDAVEAKAAVEAADATCTAKDASSAAALVFSLLTGFAMLL